MQDALNAWGKGALAVRHAHIEPSDDLVGTDYGLHAPPFGQQHIYSRARACVSAIAQPDHLRTNWPALATGCAHERMVLRYGRADPSRRAM